ncbi:MAG: type III pantothenate kinase [Sphingobacteriaceae bacterium]|nr:MAG: type III pantothenate kinase [Sphingobacteriaceae bacterium]
MANLVIDIGNTYTKVAVFDNNVLVYGDQYTVFNTDDLLNCLDKHIIKKAIVSTVKNKAEEWETVLNSKADLIHFNAATFTGINNKYLTPQTLGADRLAAVIGANYSYPDANNLVIDGGTCITYDFIDADKNYWGGSISPGLNMRYNALNYYTSALPLVKSNDEFTDSYGNNTTNAILSGVQNGIKHELTGFIESYIKSHQQINIILTGGDSIFFDTLLKNSIFAPYIKIEPHLVLIGLNAAIQEHND